MPPAVRNSIAVWDTLWASKATAEREDRYDLAKEEAGIRWQRIERRILARFGSFDGLRVVELGAGRGTNAALMARRGAAVTVLDYSTRALESAQAFFERNGIAASYVEADVLALSHSPRLGQFDIAMSFGLAEHFSGRDRSNVIKAHFDVLAARGMALISVPHAANPPYRIYKFIAERTGRWTVGEEYPFSRAELRRLSRQIGQNRIEFFGDSLAESMHFIDPRKALRKVVGATERRPAIRRERGSFLDGYLAYSLVLCAAKS